jgi:hypothetical protein
MTTTNKKIQPDNLVCPECGVSMSDKDPYAHSLTHYPEHLEPAKASKKAILYQSLILGGGVTLNDYNAAHKTEE